MSIACGCTNIQVPTGATGATGPAGPTGPVGPTGSSVIVLHNDVTDSSTSTNSLQTLKTYSLTAGKMASNGDMIHIRARFRATEDSYLKLCHVYLDSALIATEVIQFSPNNSSVLDVWITRTDTTTGDADIITSHGSFGSSNYALNLAGITAVSVSAWSSALNIDIKANKLTAGANIITCELFQVTYYKK